MFGNILDPEAVFSQVKVFIVVSAINVIAHIIFVEGGVTRSVSLTNIDPYCPRVASCAFVPDYAILFSFKLFRTNIVINSKYKKYLVYLL